MQTAFIIVLSGFVLVLLDLLYLQLRDYLAVKYNFVLWPSHTERVIRSSRRKLRKLNQTDNLSRIRYLFTLADGNEKGLIEEYCRSEDMSVDEFLKKVAVEDANSWKTMRDELELVLGPQPALARPPKTIEEHIRWLDQIGRIEPIFFRLPIEEYDKVARHLARGRLSDRYLGRLAVAVINQRRAAMDESIHSLPPPS